MGTKPITRQGDLAELPPALAPLIGRPQWAIWRWTKKSDGSWQKPPFIAADPRRNASSADPSTWTDYDTALAAVQAGRGDGITYVLTENDPFAAVDLDHCRDAETHSIDTWAQKFLARARGAYAEITPSGDGLRIWGLADGSKVHRAFGLEIDGKAVKAELFRHTNKPLTITGLELALLARRGPLDKNIDRLIDWAVIWGERRKAEAAAAAPIVKSNGGGNGCGFSIDEIEAIVRGGAPDGANRSDTFHAIIGHYLGVGWDADQILNHLGQFPNGIGERYLSEGRLSAEIARSAAKYTGTLPQLDVDAWRAKAPQAGVAWNGHGNGAAAHTVQGDPELDDPELKDPELEDAELEDPELEDDPELDDEEPESPDLPPLYAHGDPDPRPLKSWLVKHLIPAVGHGLLSGQWGAGKTFTALDLIGAAITGQLWLGHVIKRQCGALLIAAEGGNEVRLRLDAMVRAKCGGAERLPFRWFETIPTLLLHKDAVSKLVAMAEHAEASLQNEFGLPLGLIIIDTVAAAAGYAKQGAENDDAVGQAIMNVLQNLAQRMNCFVLGVDHFGKDLERGTRGASAKESSADLVLACLGEKALSGSVTETRLAVRKSRGGRQGQEHWFDLQLVQAPEPDEDGDPIETMVVNWLPSGPDGTSRPEPDPWAEPRRQEQKTAVLRLKRILMEVLAEQGVDLPIALGGPVVRMVDQETVREAFYKHTSAEGTPKQKGDFRRQKFLRALNWAEDRQLIAITEIDGVTYLYLTLPNQGGEEPEA
jgi:hypothetical protein